MNATQYAITNLSHWQPCGFLLTPISGLSANIDFCHRPAVEVQSQWVKLTLPLGKEKMSNHITDVHSLAKKIEFIPRTNLGRKLLELRKRAIDEGMRLLSEDEVLEEVRRRRGEENTNEAHIY
ncbi:MAG: hypothetical protein ACP5U1_14210 [Desulfomonilaceae bacterium]